MDQMILELFYCPISKRPPRSDAVHRHKNLFRRGRTLDNCFVESHASACFLNAAVHGYHLVLTGGPIGWLLLQSPSFDAFRFICLQSWLQNAEFHRKNRVDHNPQNTMKLRPARVRKCKAPSSPSALQICEGFLSGCGELCCETCQSSLKCLRVGFIPSPLCHFANLVSSVSNDAGSHDAMDLQKPSNLSPSSQSIKHLVELHATDQQQIL